MEIETDVETVLFDWIGTLALFDELPDQAGVEAILRSLESDGYGWPLDRFTPVYEQTAQRFWEALRPDREIHNTVWIATTLAELGVDLAPEDPIVRRATDAYFEPYLAGLRATPGAKETLSALGGRYRLGLVSNFTHAEAVYRGLVKLGLLGFFDAVSISAEVGLRKPHPGIFEHALRGLGVRPPFHAIFVGDDIEADIVGAACLGLQPILMACALKGDYQGQLADAVSSLDHGVEPLSVPIIHRLDELIPALVG